MTHDDLRWLGVIGAFIAVSACGGSTAEDGLTNEGLGSDRSPLRKGLPGAVNGAIDYCNNPSALCVGGEGDCDADAQCEPGLVCGVDNGPNFGMQVSYDVCVVPHCVNAVLDADEDAIDCGGQDCGTNCSAVCASVPPNGSIGHCTLGCPCAASEGDCNANAECEGGLVCGIDNGPTFGMAHAYDVCVVSHCNNRTRDADETVTDCGGADCGWICPSTCGGVPANGSVGHCTVDCPCAAGETDCNTNSECASAGVCRQDVGFYFGYQASYDVCVASSCSNGAMDGDESGVDCGGSCLPCSGGHIVSAGYGGPNVDAVRTVVQDAAGNIIVAGRYYVNTNMGGSDLDAAGDSPTAAEIFIAKYSPTGQHIWSRNFGSPVSDGDRDVALATDSSNSIYIGGDFQQSVDFGGGALTAASGCDMFLVKLSSTGAHLWSQRFGLGNIDRVDGLAVDRQQNLYLVGAFDSTITFGGNLLTTAGGLDVAVAKFSSAGAHLWSQRLGSSADDNPQDIAVDWAYYSWITGSFSGSMTAGSTTLTSAGSQDVFLVQLSGSGAVTVARRYGGSGADVGYAVSVDYGRNPAIGGSFSGSVNFGSGTPSTAVGFLDGFVASYGPTGAFRWARAIGSAPGNDTIYGVESDYLTGFVVATGQIGGAVAGFYPGGSSSGFVGESDAAFLGYTSAGTLTWSRAHGSSGTDYGMSASIFQNTAVFTGAYGAAMSLGGSQLPSVTGVRDVFLARYRM